MAGAAFVPWVPVQGRHTPAKKNVSLVSSRANQVGTALPLRWPYSQKEVAGIRQRCPICSQGCHHTLVVLRQLVTGPESTLGGGGKPQRIMTSSRIPSGAVRTTGAIWSGNTAGMGGRLPTYRPKHAPAAGWPPGCWSRNRGCTPPHNTSATAK
jgi:hypothetical protein